MYRGEGRICMSRYSLSILLSWIYRGILWLCCFFLLIIFILRSLRRKRLSCLLILFFHPFCLLVIILLSMMKKLWVKRFCCRKYSILNKAFLTKVSVSSRVSHSKTTRKVLAATLNKTKMIATSRNHRKPKTKSKRILMMTFLYLLFIYFVRTARMSQWMRRSLKSSKCVSTSRKRKNKGITKLFMEPKTFICLWDLFWLCIKGCYKLKKYHKNLKIIQKAIICQLK